MGPLRRNTDVVRPRRSWPRRILIACNVLLATILVAGLAFAAYGKWRTGEITRVSLGDALSGDGGGGKPMTVLMVGSDSRADLAAGESKMYGTTKDTPGLADTIMLLRVDPKSDRAAILSIPRDTYVTIAGQGSKAKINSAFSGGGKEGISRLITTIQTDFDIPIDHYAQVDFDGFKGIVNAVDGVTIRFDAPARDTHSGLNVANAGCIKLTGDQALAYARSRYYEIYEGGRWRLDPRSDLSRIDRQQDFIRRVMRKAVEKATNPFALNNMVGSIVDNLTLDDGFGLSDMLSLAKRFKSLDPSKVEMMTVPTTNGKAGGQDVQFVKQSEAESVIDHFLHGDQRSSEGGAAPSSAIAPSTISVRVLNGSGIAGQAGDAAGSLRDAGFVVPSVGDATHNVATTTIHYAPGSKAKADVIASYVQGAVTTVQDSAVRGVDAIVVTGSSFDGVKGTASAASTTTTAAPANTTTTKAPSTFVPGDSNAC